MTLPGLIKLWVKTYLLRDHQSRELLRWRIDQGDYTLRLDYPLDERSLVMDLGGFQGDFAAQMYERYQCEVFVFEPVVEFANQIKLRFSSNKKINVFPFALGIENAETTIYMNSDGSSVLKKSDIPTVIKIHNAAEFFTEHKIRFVDLAKINIEGSEYELLEYLIKTGWIRHIKNLQIQFHNFFPDACIRRKSIQDKLKISHRQTYNYDFVWENWELIEDSKIV